MKLREELQVMEVMRLLVAWVSFNCEWRAAAGWVPGVRLSLWEAWDREETPQPGIRA